ncbi:glycine/D-amino acid oxidase-like deaminating enzyme [Albidovulum inexpectatum]|uniref:Glycine/D-amino acid oxidase-like deaminating enzyme n=1 Tax=Albidovulum inexpectatum TaxID=196587 RepID=A0A2S5JJ90_9RHOB|nr:FAD-binding oxidoreductase [Albidovulum inexpectatum]PPB81539.1 glycine/D-amino acid oxidase-like deaminating enzyme [Albidovulum inexpectatum]
MKNWDIVIVGGAASGASAAWWLKRLCPKLDILVIDRDHSFARAATALSVASIRSQFSNPVNVQISRFGVDFIRNFANHVGVESGVSDLGFRENGYLFLAGSDHMARAMRDLAAVQNGQGADTRVLSRVELAERYPWMNLEDVTAGSHGARDEGWFDNMGLLWGLRRAARALGVAFLQDQATGFVRKGDRIIAVTTNSSGQIACGTVICAAGTGSPALCASAGVSIPVEHRKRTVFVIDAPRARYPDAPLIVDHLGFYLRPEGDHWIAAIVPEDDGPCAPDDWDPDLHLFETLLWPRLYQRSERFDAVKVKRAWAGHYDYNRLDQNAIVGRWPDLRNFYLATGYSGHGLQQAPAVGRALAELITTGAYQSIDLSPLSPERILSNTPFAEKAIV